MSARKRLLGGVDPLTIGHRFMEDKEVVSIGTPMENQSKAKTSKSLCKDVLASSPPTRRSIMMFWITLHRTRHQLQCNGQNERKIIPNTKSHNAVCCLLLRFTSHLNDP